MSDSAKRSTSHPKSDVVLIGAGIMSATLGASLGASTAVTAMLDVMQRCFSERYVSGWQPKLKEMIPSLGIQLSHEHELFTEVWSWGGRVLDLRQPAGHRERVVTA